MTERYLCDAMMGGLATLLRAGGHDALLAPPGASDTALLAVAEREGRLLLTRDRGLAARARDRTILLASGRADDQAVELCGFRTVDWRAAPFTRCLVDNSPLRPAEAPEIARAPPSSRALPGPFRTCPTCGRLYWPGSHVRRMEVRLRRLADRCDPPQPQA